MKVKELLKKYKTYERNELARRVEVKKKVKAARKIVKTTGVKVPTKIKKLKFNPKKYTKAIGNPYGVKLPKRKIRSKIKYKSV